MYLLMEFESLTDIWNFIIGNIIIINIILSIIIVFFQRRDPKTVWTWLLVLYFIPVFGIFIYLILGQDYRKSKMFKVKEMEDALHYSVTKQERFFRERTKGMENLYIYNYVKLIRYNLNSGASMFTVYNKVDIFNNGRDKFKNLIADIKAAQKYIHIEYYIIKNDYLFDAIAKELVLKARQGVEVRILGDGMGVRFMPEYKWNQLKAEGIKVGIFFPAMLSWINPRINYRNHRKVTIIDNRVAFVGGMNIGDEYLGKGKIGYWRDTSVKIYGDVVSSFEKEFYFSLSIVKNEFLKDEKPSNEISLKYEEDDGIYMQLISSGPNYEFPVIRDNYIKLIQEARKSVFIQTPYFVPDDLLLDTLKSAVLSGIDVKIMIPNKADHPFIYWVNQYYVGELLRLGANIYRYENGFIHSKTILVDEEVISVGTCNFDYRSFYLNFEINLNIYNKDVANSFKIQYYKDIAISKKLTFADFKMRSIFTKVKESVFRLLSPIM